MIVIVQTIITQIAVILLFILILLLADNKKKLKDSVLLILIFFCVFFVSSLILWYIPNTFHLFGRKITVHWNWFGKAGSFAFGLLFLLTVYLHKKIPFHEFKFSLKQKNESWSNSLILGGFILIPNIILLVFFHEKGSIRDSLNESFFFQLTMPGIEEELIFRGILLGLLNRVFEKRMFLFRMKFGWGLILTSILFGLVHGLRIKQGFSPDINVMRILITGIYGFLFGLVAENSDSLLLPVIFHNMSNSVLYLKYYLILMRY